VARRFVPAHDPGDPLTVHVLPGSSAVVELGGDPRCAFVVDSADPVGQLRVRCCAPLPVQ